MKSCFSAPAIALSAALVAVFSFSPALQAQCVPPPAQYAMYIDPPVSSVIACPGQTVTFEVHVEAGALDVAGFGLNLRIDAPGRVTSVVPGFLAAGGGFISEVSADGQSVAALGFRSTSGPAVQVAARITFEPDPAAQPSSFQISFNSSLPLANGIVPINHLVESASGCDVLAPQLGIRGGKLNVSTCAGNFIRGDCNNNGQVAGLTGDVWYLLNHLFLNGPSPACEAACDLNDNEDVDVSDAIYLLNWYLNTGAPPPPPSPLGGFGLAACGPDPTPGLTCANGICP